MDIIEHRAAGDLILDLARALAELTRDIIAQDYAAAQAPMADLRDRLEILAARQQHAACVATGNTEGATRHAWALPAGRM